MLAAGTIITLERGHYQLREAIGGSAYGVVWRAAGPRGMRDVALKLINRGQMVRADPQLRECWVASARSEIAFLGSLAAWDGRHIVRLLDSGMHEGLPVMALELMHTDLARHIAGATGVVPLTRMLAWMNQVNQALAKVHQYGWRYLDLKPSNLLLDQSQQTIKLADFGTNRALGDLDPHSYTGTASWQAPEQFFPLGKRQQEAAASDAAYATGARSDYFALGTLFYYLCTGIKLRFCSDCGEAYRAHRTAAAATLLERSGGHIPLTLHADESLLFSGRIRDRWLAEGGPAASQAVGAAAGESALRLLRMLLAPQPQRRPRHALDISRMLADVASPAAIPPIPAMPPADHGGPDSAASRRAAVPRQAGPGFSACRQGSWPT
jgi:serine/threonine protein kinase